MTNKQEQEYIKTIISLTDTINTMKNNYDSLVSSFKKAVNVCKKYELMLESILDCEDARKNQQITELDYIIKKLESL